MKTYAILVLVLTIILVSNSVINAFQPPRAKKITNKKLVHGTELSDDYFWLRDRADDDVMKYLLDENTYASHFMKDTENIQKLLFEEMKSRIKESDLSVPQKVDDYKYYTKTEAGKQYEIHCRKKIKNDSLEEVLFDENEYAQDESYFALGALSISPKHDILAYSVDLTGSEKFELAFKNVITGEVYPERISSTTYGIQWAEDNETVFYTLPDETGRAYKIIRHTIGSDISKDVTVYEENDGQFWVGIEKSRDRKYLIISSSSSGTSEVRYLDALNPTGEFKIFSPRRKNIEYGLAHHKGYFYIITNEDAVNFKVMKARVEESDRNKWQEFIPARNNIMIEDFEEFENYLVISEVENGLKKLKYYDITKQLFQEITFDEAVYSFYLSSNPEFETDVLRYQYQSLTTPDSVFEYNFNKGESILLKQSEVLDKNYSPSNFRSERIYARAEDGMAIPISMVYHKDLAQKYKSETFPLYLTSYGAYGVSSDPYFSSIRLSLLNRGFIYAIAQIRGGQDLGRPWYNDGKLLKKKNTFNDFISCAKLLIENGYTSKDKLVINGGSAGGLLMGAVVNARPDLFKIVIADVPFVDVINTMLDPSLPLVKEEYEEWGNPNDKEYFEYILSYSPYNNIVRQNYPNMLITAGLNDPRVSYWEPAKFTAKLRELKTDNNALILKTNMEAGHAGASGRYDYLKEIAFEYAFIFKILGIEI